MGLTATIGIDKAVTPQDAVKNILKVCGSLDVANLSTVRRNRDELAKYVPVPEEGKDIQFDFIIFVLILK